MHRLHRPGRRGVAAVGMIVLLLVVELIVIGMVLGGARDQDLTMRRCETIRAFYAAEGGMNMAIREMMLASDEDGDGGIGTISDDGDPGTDPVIGGATVSVRAVAGAGQTTLESVGVSGEARRQLEAVLEE
jgi:Tfp pilus assembly protein PilX